MKSSTEAMSEHLLDTGVFVAFENCRDTTHRDIDSVALGLWLVHPALLIITARGRRWLSEMPH
jgi:hypothetical protein